jgi:hypothetical protein
VVLKGESLDVGDGEFQVYGEFVDVAAELGVVLFELLIRR